MCTIISWVFKLFQDICYWEWINNIQVSSSLRASGQFQITTRVWMGNVCKHSNLYRTWLLSSSSKIEEFNILSLYFVMFQDPSWENRFSWVWSYITKHWTFVKSLSSVLCVCLGMHVDFFCDDALYLRMRRAEKKRFHMKIK